MDEARGLYPDQEQHFTAASITYQQLIKVLDVVGFQKREVPGRLVTHTLHSPIFRLHVEPSHAAQRRGGCSQFPSWGPDRDITGWRGEDLREDNTFSRAASAVHTQKQHRSIYT